MLLLFAGFLNFKNLFIALMPATLKPIKRNNVGLQKNRHWQNEDDNEEGDDKGTTNLLLLFKSFPLVLTYYSS